MIWLLQAVDATRYRRREDPGSLFLWKGFTSIKGNWLYQTDAAYLINSRVGPIHVLFLDDFHNVVLKEIWWLLEAVDAKYRGREDLDCHAGSIQEYKFDNFLVLHHDDLNNIALKTFGDTVAAICGYHKSILLALYYPFDVYQTVLMALRYRS